MISHDKKCIFIHIPKAAGTSVISHFPDMSRTGKKTENELPFHSSEKFDPPPPHLRASDFVKYGYVTKDIFDLYFKFSFVRNPWDRIVSEYKYRRHASRYDFKTYLFKHFPRPGWSDEYCHVIPQYDFLYDDDGVCLVDFIGRFESVQDGFNVVCEKLGLPEIMLVHKNKSLSFFRRDNNLYQVLKTIKDSLSINQRRNIFSRYTEYYDDESIAWVARIYERDVSVFGYEFGD